MDEIDNSELAQWCVADNMLTRELASVREQAAAVKPLSNSPLVSVVMTTYNSGEFVGEAIRSILTQTYWNIELVIVDDMSSDETISVIQSFMREDSRVRLVRYGYNRGTYFSKNVGILAANGEILTFMDSDDTSAPARISHQVNDLRRPGVVVSTVGYSRHFVGGRVEGKRRHAYISQMFRKELCDLVGFFDSVRTSADEEFLRRVVSVFGDSSHYFNPEVLYFARVRDDSLSHHPSNPKFSEETGGLSPARRAYIDSVAAWHAALANAGRAPFLDFPLVRRPFEVDEKLQVVRGCQQPRSRTAVLFYDDGQPVETTQEQLLKWFDRVIVVGDPSPVDDACVSHVEATTGALECGSIGPVLPGVVMILKSSYGYTPAYFRISTLILSVLGPNTRIGALVPGIDSAGTDHEAILPGATSFVLGSGSKLNLTSEDLNKLPTLPLGRLTVELSIPVAEVSNAKSGVQARLEELVSNVPDRRYLAFLSEEPLTREPIGGAARFQKPPDVHVSADLAVDHAGMSAVASGSPQSYGRSFLLEVLGVCSALNSIFNRFEKLCIMAGFAVAIALGAVVWSGFGVFAGFVASVAFMYLSSLGIFVARRTRLTVSLASGANSSNVRSVLRNFLRRVLDIGRR
ncbi:glycosyltransferase family A protein [Stenotrophomonas sp.]|uniref:glycosyltransferase family 2 protein n=1 Tax=Stenotrophomonas sp. TaxID=69392 RepID=UPI0028A6BFE6|nr:glycosyltransferase family A protein [Stenotrophomonas sp.]